MKTQFRKNLIFTDQSFTPERVHQDIQNMIKLEIVLVLLLVGGSQMEVEGARQDLQDR